MRKVLVLSVLFGFSPLLILAQNEPAGPVSCFDYYKFQSVEIDLHGEKQIYKAGEGAKFIGSITNKNNYPLVGGSLVLRISKLDPSSHVGNDIVDEWVAKENTNLRAGEKQFITVPYQLSSGLPTGTYVLTSYFLTQNKFNISGLSFTDDIYGGYATFTVEGKSEKNIRFDRTGVKVNNEPYRIFGFLPKVFPENTEVLKISVPLKNETGKPAETSLKYFLYAWDGRDENNLIKSWNESLVLPAGSQKTLSFDVGLDDRPVYFVKIKAEAGDRQSEIHLRFVKEGFRPRLVYVGLTGFPITNGETSSAFACFENSTDLLATGELDSNPGSELPKASGKLELFLKDMRGRVLANAVYSGAMGKEAGVLAKELSKVGKVDKLVLEAKLYDNKENLVDRAEVIYDCSSFAEAVCPKGRASLYVALAGVLIAVLALYFMAKRFRKEQPPIR